VTPFDSTRGSQAAYDFWLGLIPQFLGQFGGAAPGVAAKADPSASSASPGLNSLMFPADQIAKAAAMTQQSLQGLAQSLAPMLQAGGLPNLLAQWATASPAFASGKPGDAAAAAASATQAMLAPWAALMSGVAGAIPTATQGSTPPAYGEAGTPLSSLQAMSQAWTDMASRLAGTTPAQLDAAFDRTYGALGDALGFSPARKLHAAWRDVVAASVAHQDARASYALLVQGAFAQGFQRLMASLAEKANSGEHIDSVLALIRLWAIKSEEVVHKTLQSERGLAATAALTRSALAYRKKMQYMAAVVADVFDMATRRELDEAYREIQELKRELRASRPERGSGGATPKRRAATRAAAAKNRTSKANRAGNDGAGG
jgi:poly(hydroxyalkanoate) synthase III subunit E